MEIHEAANQRTTERRYIRYAWLFPFAVGALIVVAGVMGLLNGYTTENPPVPSSTPQAALDTLNSVYLSFAMAITGSGIGVAFISVTGFRYGQKWTWYYLVIQLGWLIVDELVFPGDPIAYIGIVLLAIGLVLPVRRFFPKTANTGAIPR